MEMEMEMRNKFVAAQVLKNNSSVDHEGMKI